MTSPATNKPPYVCLSHCVPAGGFLGCQRLGGTRSLIMHMLSITAHVRQLAWCCCWDGPACVHACARASVRVHTCDAHASTVRVCTYLEQACACVRVCTHVVCMCARVCMCVVCMHVQYMSYAPGLLGRVCACGGVCMVCAACTRRTRDESVPCGAAAPPGGADVMGPHREAACVPTLEP